MFSIGLTGGICSGKTQFAALLEKISGAACFNADKSARKHLEEDPEIIAEIRKVFGDSIFRSDGKPDRESLRAIIFTNSDKRKVLEALIHPKVWADYEDFKQRESHKSFSFADIPLIYETNSQHRVDAVAVVATSPDTQIQRLIERRGIPRDEAQKIIASQLPQSHKLHFADYLIWNDGSLGALAAQAKILIKNIF